MPRRFVHGRWGAAALLLIVAAAAARAAVQDPPPLLARPFDPHGERLAVPGAPDCFVYIAAWETGSWYDREGQKRPAAWQVEKVADTRDARRDVDEVKRWLSAMLEQSEDMRNKTKAACEATGFGFVQIGVVRDDPDSGPGAWFRGTPVILIDMGDIEQMGKHAETPGAGNPSIQGTAARTVSSLLPASLIAHELDHARRAQKLASRAKKERQAIEDENTVISELRAFKHVTYARKDYSDGTGRITFEYKAAAWSAPIEVKLNVDKALSRTERRDDGHDHFVDVSDEDHELLEKVPQISHTSQTTWTLTARYDRPKDSPGDLLVRIFGDLRLGRLPTDPPRENVLLRSIFAPFERAPTAPKVQRIAVVSGPSVATPSPSGPTGLNGLILPAATSKGIAGQGDAKLFLVSLGQTTGEAFKVIGVNNTNVAIRLMADTLALRPLTGITERDVDRELMAMDGTGGQPRIVARIDGYCLEFGKAPPPAGMVFVPADDPAEQLAVEPVGRIVDAVRQLRARGALTPDSDDANEYAHDIVQWSIWTHREDFDQTRFTTAFVDHVRKNFAAAGDPWTRDVQRTVTGLAPARWKTIQTVLADAAALEPW